MSGRMRRIAAVPIGLALVAAAYLVSATVPGEDAREAPFVVSGESGDRLLGRTLDATLLDAVLVDVLESADWRGTSGGIWLVTQFDVAAIGKRTGLDAVLEVDGLTYAATDRSDDVLNDRVYDPMLPYRGVIAFEFPSTVLESDGARSAVVRLTSGIDSRLDTVLEFRLDLTSLVTGETLELGGPREVAP